jgi:deoxyribonuclease V
VDAAFSADKVFAAVCVHRYPDMALIEQTAAAEKISFPYVPGYLFFLEGPAILSALERLRALPDIILFDGHGSAQPRNIGAASHLGLLLDIPTIGCAKKRLVGEYTEPDTPKGSWSVLRLEEKTVGAVLRTRDNVAPVFVSPGHRTDLEDAIRITLRCTGKFRIPEPLRCADSVSGRMKKRLA